VIGSREDVGYVADTLRRLQVTPRPAAALNTSVL
jgi:hypothetical protein